MLHSIKRFYPVAIAGALSLLPLAVAAQGKLSNIVTLLGDFITVLQTLLIVIFGIAVVVFSWGIVKYITAAGDPAKLKEAKSFILWGVILIAILVLIFGIVDFLRDALDLGTPTGIEPPTLPGL